VGIAGEQTGIYPADTPGGWQIIGRTPLRLFDPRREPMSLLLPGDEVRFAIIDEQGYEELSQW
jgi:allophanate hydrolase subunit 1